ncbi:MAG: CinA family protein [Betaproteobacteria bacterium]|nr:CinA family protein [Betaproteobacteria bacterium]
MEYQESLDALAQRVGSALKARGLLLATAESCTGGLVSAAITGVAGSSDWFERGFVTYSNAAKHSMLGVPTELIAQHGAVSEAVARAMAEGALAQSLAQVALSITGVAGPGGGSADKPVGTVWHGFAVQHSDGSVHTQCVLQHYAGDRAAVREQAVRFALATLCASTLEV